MRTGTRRHIFVGILALSTVLVGCSSDTEDRNASGLYKPTSICVINDSASRMQVNYKFGDNVSDEKILWENAGDKACGSGSSSTGVIDVGGEFLTTNPDRTWWFASGNRVIRAPGVNVGYRKGGTDYSCFGQEFEVNQSASFDDGFVKVTATRLPDTDSKNFEIRVTDTSSPSTTGQAKTCRSIY